jgi:hypothetical protein
MKNFKLKYYYFFQIIFNCSFYSIIILNTVIPSQKTQKARKGRFSLGKGSQRRKRKRKNIGIKLNKNNQKDLSRFNKISNNSINKLIEETKQFKKNQELEISKATDENKKQELIEKQKKDLESFLKEQSKKVNDFIIENVKNIINPLKQSKKIPNNFQENNKSSFLNQQDMQKIQMAETYIKNTFKTIEESMIGIKLPLIEEENRKIFKNIHDAYINQNNKNYQIDEKNLKKINEIYF